MDAVETYDAMRRLLCAAGPRLSAAVRAALHRGTGWVVFVASGEDARSEAEPSGGALLCTPMPLERVVRRFAVLRNVRELALVIDELRSLAPAGVCTIVVMHRGHLMLLRAAQGMSAKILGMGRA